MEEKPRYEIIEYEGREARKWPDGSIRDELGRVLTRPPALDAHTITTSEQGAAMVRLRRQKKIDAFVNALNDLAEDVDRDKFGDLAYVAAVARAAYSKATDPKDPKQTEAARFILKETGISESGHDGSTQADENMSILAALGAKAVEHILQRAREGD